MTIPTLEKAIEFIDKIVKETNGDNTEILFHGGEPLLNEYDFWETALTLISKQYKAKNRRLSIQSNLWLLDESLCELFREYDITLSTSLDGPEKINDAQRGNGCFHRTMKGIRIAQKFGINIGCIATLYRIQANDPSTDEELVFVETKKMMVIK